MLLKQPIAPMDKAPTGKRQFVHVLIDFRNGFGLGAAEARARL